MYKKKIWIQLKICTKLTFPPHQQKWHNRTIVLYTKYVRNTKNYFPPEQKTDTTAQLEKKFLQPTRSKCIWLSVCNSIRL